MLGLSCEGWAELEAGVTERGIMGNLLSYWEDEIKLDPAIGFRVKSVAYENAKAWVV